MGQGRGNSETPPRVQELLKKAVEESSQSAIAKATGLPIGTINRSLKGVGEPTKGTLEKLAKHFKVSTRWLLGSMVIAGLVGGGETTEQQNSELYIYKETFRQIKEAANNIKTDLDAHIETAEGVYMIMKLTEIFDRLREVRGLFDTEEFSSLHSFFWNANEILKERHSAKIDNVLRFEVCFIAQELFG